MNDGVERCRHGQPLLTVTEKEFSYDYAPTDCSLCDPGALVRGPYTMNKPLPPPPLPDPEPVPANKKSMARVAMVMSRVFKECMLLREAGQKEYAHNEDNAFANFDRVAADLGLDRKQVLMVYMRKHFDGIVAYVNGHKSQREDVRGRIKDMIVYLGLLYGMVESEES